MPWGLSHNPKVVGSNPAPATMKSQVGSEFASDLFRVSRHLERQATQDGLLAQYVRAVQESEAPLFLLESFSRIAYQRLGKALHNSGTQIMN